MQAIQIIQVMQKQKQKLVHLSVKYRVLSPLDQKSSPPWPAKPNICHPGASAPRLQTTFPLRQLSRLSQLEQFIMFSCEHWVGAICSMGQGGAGGSNWQSCSSQKPIWPSEQTSAWFSIAEAIKRTQQTIPLTSIMNILYQRSILPPNYCLWK